MKSVSTYKILKTSWGIWIQITASTKKLIYKDENLLEAYQVSPKIFIRESPELNIYLNEDNLKFLIGGLKWVAKKIEESIETPILITFEHIQLMLNDFQKEGLFYSSAFWASEHFKFKMPEYKYSYNRLENKYEFPDLTINKKASS